MGGIHLKFYMCMFFYGEETDSDVKIFKKSNAGSL